MLSTTDNIIDYPKTNTKAVYVFNVNLQNSGE